MSPIEEPTPPPEAPAEPQSAEDFLRRGWREHVEQQFSRAEADFRRAISLEPNSVEAAYALGLALKMQERGSEAIQEFERAIQLISAGNMADDPPRATMLRHLSEWHITTIQSGTPEAKP